MVVCPFFTDPQGSWAKVFPLSLQLLLSKLMFPFFARRLQDHLPPPPRLPPFLSIEQWRDERKIGCREKKREERERGRSGPFCTLKFLCLPYYSVCMGSYSMRNSDRRCISWSSTLDLCLELVFFFFFFQDGSTASAVYLRYHEVQGNGTRSSFKFFLHILFFSWYLNLTVTRCCCFF